mgnify:CR=1 FL=1
MEFNYQKKKTYTKYWNNFSEQPKKFIGTSMFFKRLKKFLNNLLGFTISIRLKKNKPQKDEAYISYPIEENIKKHRNNLIIKEMHSLPP